MNSSTDLNLKKDIDDYKVVLDNYEVLSSEDGYTAYELAKQALVLADRWSEISFQSSQYSAKYEVSKSAFYDYAYRKYRVLMQVHEFCRVVYRQCSENLRNRMDF